jgi:SOS-response transcriptional repressor LexA
MMGLTSRQLQLVKFIDSFMKANGFSPSYEEMGRAVGCTKGMINHAIERLKDRGYVTNLPRQARSITVVRVPGERAAPMPSGADLEQAPTVSLLKLLNAVESELDRRAAA